MATAGYHGGQNNPYDSAAPNTYEQAAYAEEAQANPYSTETATPEYQNPDYAQSAEHQNASYPLQQSTPLSNQEFLTRVESVRSDIRQLTSNVSEIGTLHQRSLSSTDGSQAPQLEQMVSQTQILNTRIKDQIKFLETDSVKSGKPVTKNSQIKTLKGHFKDQLQQYEQEERSYRKRYEDQIARQYKIINPEASDAEIKEAASADWGNEGVFQTALKSNRSGTANSALGAVRARHIDIQQIEKTLEELSYLFTELATEVQAQEFMVDSAEQRTESVNKDNKEANRHLGIGIKHAKNARKLKWWCFGIVVVIICILALILGLYFGLPNAGYHANHHKMRRMMMARSLDVGGRKLIFYL